MSDSVPFGRYHLTQRIAVGGMAEVFWAELHGPFGFNKPLIIKRILPQHANDPEFLRMFATEAKLAGQLVHPNIVQVYELGEVDGQYFIAMERVDGLDLRLFWQVLARDRQRLPATLALYITAELLHGIDFAHRAIGHDHQPLGVVHRDVSPSNVLVSWRGDVKVADFGIALVQREARGAAHLFKGKHEYMSPEQLSGRRIDHRADIFSAGVVLAELLLGRRLFTGQTEIERLERVAGAKIDTFERHAKVFPACVAEIVRHALQRDPEHRYPSARDFRRATLECLSAISPGDPVDAEVLASFVARHIAPRLTADDRSACGASGEPPRRGHGSLPVFSREIVPDDAELTPPPFDAPSSFRER